MNAFYVTYDLFSFLVSAEVQDSWSWLSLLDFSKLMERASLASGSRQSVGVAVVSFFAVPGSAPWVWNHDFSAVNFLDLKCQAVVMISL